MTAILDLPRVTVATYVVYVMSKDTTIGVIMPMDYDLDQARHHAPAGTFYFYFEQVLEVDGDYVTDTHRIPGNHYLIGQLTENCGSEWDNTLVLPNGRFISLNSEDSGPDSDSEDGEDEDEL